MCMECKVLTVISYKDSKCMVLFGGSRYDLFSPEFKHAAADQNILLYSALTKVTETGETFIEVLVDLGLDMTKVYSTLFSGHIYFSKPVHVFKLKESRIAEIPSHSTLDENYLNLSGLTTRLLINAVMYFSDQESTIYETMCAFARKKMREISDLTGVKVPDSTLGTAAYTELSTLVNLVSTDQYDVVKTNQAMAVLKTYNNFLAQGSTIALSMRRADILMFSCLKHLSVKREGLTSFNIDPLYYYSIKLNSVFPQMRFERDISLADYITELGYEGVDFRRPDKELRADGIDTAAAYKSYRQATKVHTNKLERYNSALAKFLNQLMDDFDEYNYTVFITGISDSITFTCSVANGKNDVVAEILTHLKRHPELTYVFLDITSGDETWSIH